jgi:uncharacterized repeat protein (TIGR01451 family)
MVQPRSIHRLPGTATRPRPARSIRRLVGLLGVLSGVLLLAHVPAAMAATFTVTTTADSGAGSLRQAITDANTAGTGNTIAFAIPGSGPFTISPASALPLIGQDNTTIDACTQPGSDCSGLPLTLRVQLSGQGFSLTGFGVTIRGFSFTGAGAAVTFNRVARNAAFQLQDDVTIEHNYVGLRPDGSAAGKTLAFQFQPGQRNIDPPDRLRIAGNVIGSNSSAAINLSASALLASKPIRGVRIAGNVIGLDPTGSQPRPNTGDGIVVDTSSGMQITGNAIAGNGGVGIRHRGRAQAVRGTDPAVDPGLLIQGNVVSGNAGGGIVLEPDPPVPAVGSADAYGGPINVRGNTVHDNGGAGIAVTAAAETLRPNLTIGGTGAGEGNTITGNGGAGVAVGANTSDTSVAVSVRGNSIYANTGPKIDLASDGATDNGPAGTARTGPNALVNFPLITSIAHGSVIISGSYAGAPTAAYTLDFYKSQTVDGPQTWIGSTPVTTNADGVATYRAELEPDVPEGWFVAATATAADGSTSEFDSALVVPPRPPVPAVPAVSHELSITDGVSRGRVTVGDTVTYTLVAKNAGPDAAGDLRITDALPSRVDARSATTTQGTCSVTGNAVSCSTGTLAAGATVTVTIRAVAIKPGSAPDAAKVVAPSGGVDDLANNAGAATIRIAKPILRLTQAINRTTIGAGRTATYTIRVRNPSKRGVRNVRVCDRLPSGLVYVSSTPTAKLTKSGYCWTTKTLWAGRSRTYRITVRALGGASGRKANRATASSAMANTDRATRTIRVLGARAAGGGVTG